MKQEIREAVEKVHEIFFRKGWTLSAAESCTGGFISHCITSLPGASAFFKAGIVSYSDDAKRTFLGISLQTILESEVVTEKTAREMAESVRRIAASDFSVSTTGNLGPAMLEGKDRGLIYIAASCKEETFSRELRLKGDRLENMEETTLEALKLLLRLTEAI
ncbi:MAG: CinA family protein [Nitrospirae bacterium]|nr:CinA family protein [Nitrospirota bacterium]